MQLRPDLLIEDRYRLLAPLGQGAAGEVWRARRETDGREVALKLLRQGPEVSPELADRFLSEARVLATLHSPHVVKVLDVGHHGGQPFYAMELVDGPSLASRLKRGPSPRDRSIALCAGLARGLDAIHGAGVVHRDLKPANVVLADGSRPVIIDLGIARSGLRQGPRTRTGLVLGTPGYLAPEVLQGHPATPAADVYALGILLFQVRTGELPFSTRNLAELLAAQIRGDHRAVARRLDPRLSEIFLEATDLDPERRPGAGELATRLEALGPAPGCRTTRPGPRPPPGGAQLNREPRSRRRRPRGEPATLRSGVHRQLGAEPRRGGRGRGRLPLIGGLLLLMLLGWFSGRPGGQAPAPSAPAEPRVKPGPSPAEPGPASIRELISILEGFDYGRTLATLFPVGAEPPLGERLGDRMKPLGSERPPQHERRPPPPFWSRQERAARSRSLALTPWGRALDQLRERVTSGWWLDLPPPPEQAEARDLRLRLARALVEIQTLNRLDRVLNREQDLVPGLEALLSPVIGVRERPDLTDRGDELGGRVLLAECRGITRYRRTEVLDQDLTFQEFICLVPPPCGARRWVSSPEFLADLEAPVEDEWLHLVVGLYDLLPTDSLEVEVLSGEQPLMVAAARPVDTRVDFITGADCQWQPYPVELSFRRILMGPGPLRVRVRNRELLEPLLEPLELRSEATLQLVGMAERRQPLPGPRAGGPGRSPR